MRRHEARLDELGVDVAVVTFEAGAVARAYAAETALTWPLLVDESRALYHAYDMLQAGFWDVWGPRTLWAYAKALLRGERLHAAGGDTSQRGGDVVVDPDGVVRMHHVGGGPADRPPVADILRIVERAPRAGAGF